VKSNVAGEIVFNPAANHLLLLYQKKMFTILASEKPSITFSINILDVENFYNRGGG
jgi:hypothetical protein